jgi:SpoVK/Ycf46/Vps4 family AAA+-type ATPase
MDEAPVIRALRDLAVSMRDSYSTVVILTPVMKVPSELEKELTVIDFPLPTREELGQLFDEMIVEARNNPSLQIEDNEESRRALFDGALGLTATEVENVFAKILLKRGRLTAAEAPEVYQEKRQIVRKSGLLEYIDTEESIESIGGLHHLKAWLEKRRHAFHPAARRFGLPMPKGLMLLGVQGCGKSLAAKAVSQYWNMPLLRLDMGRLFGSLVGASEDNVRRAVKLAETIAPAILWIDEIDKGFAGLSSSGMSDSGTTSRVFATLLTWFQEKTSPVFVIATANNVEQLPPELLRQGRFDEIFFIDLPTAAEREEIFRIHLAKRRRDPAKFDLKELAEAAKARNGGDSEEGFAFNGAEIEQSIISGLYDAFFMKRDLNQEILLNAMRETSPLSKIMADDISNRRKWAAGRTRPAS